MGSGTRSPASRSLATVRSTSNQFWNTPPESTTVEVPRRSASRAHASAVAFREGVVQRPPTVAGEAPRPRCGGRERSAGVEDRHRPRAHALTGTVGEEQRHRVRPILLVARAFELSRGLALVVDCRAEAAQRRRRAEQPPRAGRWRRADPGANELAHRIPAAAFDRRAG